jgi:putative transposase
VQGWCYIPKYNLIAANGCCYYGLRCHVRFVSLCLCMMSSHVHLMTTGREKNLGGILRDFKKFTSKQIIAAIESNEQESRKEWTLSIFKQQGENNSRNSGYQFWRQDNQKNVTALSSVFKKLNYIHNNPVEAGIVEKAEDYLYSSARSYQQGNKDQLLEVQFL